MDEDNLTLRDKFALSSLHALIIEPEWDHENSAVQALLASVEDPLHVMPVADRYAIAAYMLADAMMRVRKLSFGSNGKLK